MYNDTSITKITHLKNMCTYVESQLQIGQNAQKCAKYKKYMFSNSFNQLLNNWDVSNVTHST